MELRTETLQLPTGPDARERLVRILSAAVGLSNVNQVVINGSGVALTRAVDGPVWPLEMIEGMDTDLVGYDFILKRIELQELPVERCAFPPDALQAAAELLGNQIVGFLCPPGEAGPAYFGLEGTPAVIFGYPVIYGDSETTKLIVVGGPNHYWSEAREGVVVELEVGL